MATIGVFAMNMSPKSGGVYSLTDGLMCHTHHSRHRFIYLSPPRAGREALAGNVQLIERSDRARLATQVLLNLPRAASLLRGRKASMRLLGACAQVSPSLFEQADAWLWPHAFMPIPNLPNTMVICHDMIHRREPDCFSRAALRRRAQAETGLPRCTSILCPSQATANDLLDAYPTLRPKARVFWEAPSEVLGEGQCRDEMNRIDAQYGDKPFVLFVGVDWPHKNHKLLIDAAAMLKQRGATPFRIILVGHRRGDAIGKMIEQAGVGDVVIDEAAVSRTRLAALYRSATLFAFPSRSEGFGIPLVEAMQCGTAIIASNRTCIPEIVGDAGHLLDPDDTATWANTIATLLADETARAHLGELARKRGRKFSWANTWRQLDDAFVLADKPHAMSA